MKVTKALMTYLDYLKVQGRSERTLYTYGKDVAQISAFFGGQSYPSKESKIRFDIKGERGEPWVKPPFRQHNLLIFKENSVPNHSCRHVATILSVMEPKKFTKSVLNKSNIYRHAILLTGQTNNPCDRKTLLDGTELKWIYHAEHDETVI